MGAAGRAAAIRGRAPAGERKAGSSKREGGEPRGRGFSYVEGKQLHRGYSAPGTRGWVAPRGFAAGCFQAYKTHRRRGTDRLGGTREGGWEQWTGGHTARCGGRVQRELAAQRGRSVRQLSAACSAGCSVRVVRTHVLHTQAGHSPRLGISLQGRTAAAGRGLRA